MNVNAFRIMFSSRSSCRACFCDVAGVRQALYFPAQIHQAPGFGLWKNSVGQIEELGFEHRVRHGVLDAADGILDELFQAAAIFQNHGGAGLFFLYGRVRDGRYSIAQRDGGGVADALSLNCFSPAMP